MKPIVIRDRTTPQKTISGSSMDALRLEGSHLNKLFDRQTQLQKILRQENLNPTDKQIVKELLNDIQNAITEHYSK